MAASSAGFSRLASRRPGVSNLGRAAVAHFERLDRLGLAVCLGLGVFFGLGFALSGAAPTDANMYWNANDIGHLYGQVWTLDDRYAYPPAFAILMLPLHLLGWRLFVFAWILLMFAGLWVATRAWAIPVILVAAIPAIAWGFGWPGTEILHFPLMGNVQVLVAAAIVLGFRWPAAWSFVLLTKIAPGVGVLWFAFRREWRNLGVALGATLLIAGVTFLIAPGAWAAFGTFVISNDTTPSPIPVVPIPLVIRLPMSVALIWWGARTDRPWTVPIAAGWASLALYQWSYLAVWIAALPLLDLARFRRAPAAAQANLDEGASYERA
jgi:hypothetical protein